VDNGLERDAVALLELLELPERDLPARRHQGPLGRLPRQEERPREGMAEALCALPLREAAEQVAELVGGREPHPVVREITVDRDERDSAAIPREALEPPDVAELEHPYPLLLQEPEQVRHRPGAEVPDPAGFEAGIDEIIVIALNASVKDEIIESINDSERKNMVKLRILVY